LTQKLRAKTAQAHKASNSQTFASFMSAATWYGLMTMRLVERGRKNLFGFIQNDFYFKLPAPPASKRNTQVARRSCPKIEISELLRDRIFTNRSNEHVASRKSFSYRVLT